MWKYNIASNEWTWMNGSNTLNTLPVYGTQGIPAATNTPGGRYVYCSWKDKTGNLWLFAGEDTALKKNNDLWKYDISINQWTWIKGSNFQNAEASVFPLHPMSLLPGLRIVRECPMIAEISGTWGAAIPPGNS
jgi:hypothetical protein